MTQYRSAPAARAAGSVCSSRRCRPPRTPAGPGAASRRAAASAPAHRWRGESIREPGERCAEPAVGARRPPGRAPRRAPPTGRRAPPQRRSAAAWGSLAASAAASSRPRWYARWRSRSARLRPGGDQALAAVLPQRLQEAVARCAGATLLGAGRRREHERRVHQAQEPAPARRRRPGGASAAQASASDPPHDRLGGLQREGAGEDRQPDEQRPLGRGQKFVAPVHRALSVCWRGRAVRLPPVSRRKRSSRRAATASTGRPRTCCAANSRASGMPSRRRHISDHGRGVPRRSGRTPAPRRRRGRRTGARRRSPGAPRRRGCRRPAGRPGTARGRRPRRRRRAAPGWWPAGARRARAQERLGQLGAGVHQVLAVVQHQQQAPPAQGVARARSAGRASGVQRHAHRLRHRLGHQVRVGQRRQFHQPHPVRVRAPRWTPGRGRPRRPGASCPRPRGRSASPAGARPPGGAPRPPRAPGRRTRTPSGVEPPRGAGGRRRRAGRASPATTASAAASSAVRSSSDRPRASASFASVPKRGPTRPRSSRLTAGGTDAGLARPAPPASTSWRAGGAGAARRAPRPPPVSRVPPGFPPVRLSRSRCRRRRPPAGATSSQHTGPSRRRGRSYGRITSKLRVPRRRYERGPSSERVPSKTRASSLDIPAGGQILQACPRSQHGHTSDKPEQRPGARRSRHP